MRSFSVCISSDDPMIISGSGDGTIKLWDIDTGELRHTLSGHGGWVTSVSISPDGRTLVSGSSDKTIKLWRVTAPT
jgi:WD40 repeat protein